MADRYRQLKRLYTDVFTARTDYVPLIVTLRCCDAPAAEEFWNDVSGSAAKTARAYRPRLEIGSDWIPTVNVSVYQCVIVPSLYGAEIVEIDGSEPICKPCFQSLAEAIDTAIPRVDGPAIDRMLETLHSAKRALPDEYCLSFPVTSSPFDLAQLMIGEDFLSNLLASPDDCMTFLTTLAKLAIEVIQLVKDELNLDRDEFITNRGIFFPGFRLPCDAIVNYSPDVIRDIVLPVLKLFRDGLGPLCIHFCTEPAASRHVLGALLESDDVIAVDNWQGPEVFIGPHAPARMQSKVAIIGDVDFNSSEKMDDFLAQDPVHAVPRRGGRGMVLSTRADSVDDGKRLYDQWQQRFE